MVTPVLSRSINPIHRVRKSAGLTLAKAAREAGCHIQAFFLQEQGVYPDILPAIQSWLVQHDEYLAKVSFDYHEYQRIKRRENGEAFGLAIYELGPPSWANQFVQFRNDLNLSRMGFAKRFCVHPGLLYRVEQGISQTLPDGLRAALADAGLPERVINELAFRMEEVA